MPAIVVTSGGTRVNIDDVRYIGNFSKGAFGAKIVEACENISILYDESKGVIKIHHVRAADAVKPQLHSYFKNFYEDHRFETYDDYARIVEDLLRSEPIDLIFSAAAVSDYGVKKTEGKISSDEDNLTIKLIKLPKILPQLKNWSINPNLVQVGFKLLSNVTQEVLQETAIKAGDIAGSDFTVANDLQSFLKHKPEVLLYDHKNRTGTTFPVVSKDEVEALVDNIVRLSGLAEKWEIR